LFHKLVVESLHTPEYAHVAPGSRLADSCLVILHARGGVLVRSVFASRVLSGTGASLRMEPRQRGGRRFHRVTADRNHVSGGGLASRSVLSESRTFGRNG